MRRLIQLLHEGGYSCVIACNGEVYTYSQRGIMDLCQLVTQHPERLGGASVADKVVGKGAAGLLVLGGVRELYADLISLPALALLRRHGVKVEFQHVVPHIWNRTKTDTCPVEKICGDVDTVDAMLPLIVNFVDQLQSNQNE